MIYHIISKEKWNQLKNKSYYSPNSLSREGYIHCSYAEQLLKVAQTFYKGQRNLVVLCINESKISNLLKSEDLFNLKENYPHVYGELPVSCIEKIVELLIDSNGDFIKPNLDPLSSLVVKQKEWT